MEEVGSSNLPRSTKIFKDLALALAVLVAFAAVTGIHLESYFGRRPAAREKDVRRLREVRKFASLGEWVGYFIVPDWEG